MPKITIPAALKTLTDNKDQLMIIGLTIKEVLNNLVATYPKLSRYIFDDKGEQCSFINIYVNDADVRFLNQLNTLVNENDNIMILAAIAGG